MKLFAMITIVVFAVAVFLAALPLFAEDVEAGNEARETALAHPCCIGFLTKTRSAKMVGKGRVCFSLMSQHMDYEEVMGGDGYYHRLAEGDENRKLKAVLVAKYGWAKHHHAALGVPYLRNHTDVAGTVARNDGLGNVFVFEKWNCIKESRYMPAVSVDAWYYLPTGNADRKLGSSDDALKFTAEISKTWKYFSLHINPGYTFREGSDTTEANAAVLLTPTKRFWPMVEYNFTSFSGGGNSHDIVPGVMWRFYPGACLRVGVVINGHSSMKYRDEVGVAARISYRF